MNAVIMALDSIREKKGRSFLTMLGIIIGVTAVLVLVAMVSGYNADITAYYEKLGVNKVNITLTWYDRTRAPDVYDAVYTYGNETLGDMVEGVSPTATTSLPVKYRTTTLEESTIYLGSDQFAACNNYVLEDGRDLSELDIQQRNKVCVLGSYVADSLFPYTDPIGETVYLSGIPFTVAGTYYQKDGGTEDSMDDMVSVPYSLNRELLESADVTAITVKVDTSDHVETVLNALDAYLAERISSSVGEYSLENGNSAMTESTEETASGMGTISLSRITSNSLSGSLNVAARTLGSVPLAANVVLYDRVGQSAAVQVELEDIRTGTVASSDITYAGTNADGEVDVIVLDDVTGNAYTYGILRTGTQTEGSGEMQVTNRTVAVENGGGTTQDYLTGTQVRTGTVGGVAATSDGKTAGVVLLEEVEGVARSAFSGEDTVVLEGVQVPVSEDVQVYNTDSETWVTLAQAKAYADTFTVYYSGTLGEDAVVRVVLTE